MNKAEMKTQLNRIQKSKVSNKKKAVRLIDTYHEIDSLSDADEQDRIDIRHQIYTILNKMNNKIPKTLKLSLSNVVYSYEEWKKQRKIWA